MPQLFTFQGVGQAQVSNRPPKLKGGFIGTVEIKRTEVKRTRNAGDKMFVEFDIIESNMPQVHPQGQRCSWGQSLLDTNVSGGALKVFVAAVAGIALDNEPQLKALEPHMDTILNEAVSQPESNRLVGRRVRVETNQIKTQNNRDFTVHNWYPV